nr:hypothetical protein CFP56_70667 [Quercus suber]
MLSRYKVWTRSGLALFSSGCVDAILGHNLVLAVESDEYGREPDCREVCCYDGTVEAILRPRNLKEAHALAPLISDPCEDDRVLWSENVEDQIELRNPRFDRHGVMPIRKALSNEDGAPSLMEQPE